MLVLHKESEVVCVQEREGERERGRELVPKTILNCTNCSLLALHFNAGKYVLPMGTMSALHYIALKLSACKTNQIMKLSNETLTFFCNFQML
jgi:hypothetical protein